MDASRQRALSHKQLSAADSQKLKRREERKQRNRERKEQFKRVYTNKWERRIMRFVSIVTDRFDHRKRPVVFYDQPTETLYVGDKKFYGKSFNYFSVQHVVRRGAITLVCDPLAQKILVVLLMLHSASVLFQDPQSTNSSIDSEASGLGTLVNIMDRLLLFVFAIEICVSIMAYQFIPYITSPFKLLDVAVVGLGVAIDAVPVGNSALPYLLALNALRPLRVVQRISGMRKLILVVVSCLPTMASVALLIMFLLLMFSMSFVILFPDSMHARCYDGVSNYENACTPPSNSIDWFTTTCDSFGGFSCFSNTTTFYQYASFDNVGQALLIVIQIITFDDWMVPTKTVMASWTPVSWVFFFFASVIGAFWAVNLMLAVITDAFSRFFTEEQAEREAIQLSAAEGQLHNVKTSISKALQGDMVGDSSVAVAHDAKKALQAKLQSAMDEESLDSYVSSEEENSLLRERLKSTGPANPFLRADMKVWAKHLAKAAQTSIKNGLDDATIRRLHDDTQRAQQEAAVSSMASGSSAASEDVRLPPPPVNKDAPLSRYYESSFDDRDIMAMVHLHRLNQDATTETDTPALRRVKAQAAVKHRTRMIEDWLASMDDQNETSVVDALDDSKYDVLLIVPEASFALGTRGKMFDGMLASKKGLSLFDRYAAVARENIEEEEKRRQEEEEARAEQMAAEAYQKAMLGRERYVGFRARTFAFLNRLATNVFQVGATLSDELLKSATEAQQMTVLQLVESIHRSPRFTTFMTLVVLANCFALATVYYGMTEGHSIFVDSVSAFVDFVVVADFATGCWFDGWKPFVKRMRKSVFGFVDACVAVFCALDFVLAETHVVPALRILRVLRCLKVFRHFTLLHWIFALIRSSIHYLINLLLLLLMFATVFAISGRHTFDQWIPDPPECGVHFLPATCNQDSSGNCVFVTQDQWLTVADFTQLQTWNPPELANITDDITLLYMTNASYGANTTTREYIDALANYTCRQYINWQSLQPQYRFSFNSFGNSFLTIFNFITKDGTAAITYLYMKNSPSASVYFLSVLILGGYVLTSLLVAILLVNFGKIDEMETETAADAEDRIDEEQKRRDQESMKLEQMKAQVEALRSRTTTLDSEASSTLNMTEAELELRADLKAHGGIANLEAKAAEESPDHSDETTMQGAMRIGIRALNWLCDCNDPIIDPAFLDGRSFGFFSTTNKIRLFCVRIYGGAYFPFQRVVFLCALIHGSTAVVDKTFASDGVYLVAVVLDYIFTGLAFIDLLIRLVAQGSMFGPTSFWAASVSNKADAIAVMCSVIAMVVQAANLPANATGFVDVPIMLKALRPIRLMVRSKATKNVFLAVWKTVPSMLNILGLAAIMFLATAIMSVEAFGGIMQVCSDGSDRSRAECIGNWSAPYLQTDIFPVNGTSAIIPRSWENPSMFHFDNVFVSFNTLVSVAFVSQWSQIMFGAIDAPYVPGDAPQRDNRPAVALFFIVWIFFSNFCLLNIFVGTVVDKFTKLKLQMAGSLFLTEEQSEIAHIKKLLHQSGAKKALSLSNTPFINRQLNVWCFKLANHKAVIYAVKLAALYNVAVIATVHRAQSDTFVAFQMWSTIAVSVVFLGECVLKVCIAGPKAYFQIGFNRVDAIVVVQSLTETVLFFAVDGYAEHPYLQIFRLLRMLRLVRDSKGFRRLVHTGIRSLPAMWNIGSLLFLVFYVFSFIAMSLFKDVRITPFNTSWKWILDTNINFLNFPRAMISLYAVASLDNWSDIMQGAAIQPPYCNNDVDGMGCGHVLTAYFFFNFFILTVAFVMVNLFIAVVLENFSESVLLPTYMKERMQDVNLFRSAWVAFDPAGRQVISASAFVPLLKFLPGPHKRLEQLQGKGGADDVSENSWTPQEMEYYAAHCAVGLQGEPHASIIPTLKQIDVYVTMPRQEVLFVDAIDAIGEKIFHVKLVTESALHARAKKLAVEYGHRWRIVDYYCAVVIQKAWRDYAKAQREGIVRNRYKRWDAVLAPILQRVWAHHAVGVFGDESAEEAQKIRKLTRGSRRGKRTDADENDASTSTEKHIKDRLSLATALAEKMVAVDEEQPEDDSWKRAVDDVESSGSSEPDELSEDFWLTDIARRRKREAKARGLVYEPGADDTREGGQLVTLAELIQRHRRKVAREARMSAAARQKAARIQRDRPKWVPDPIPDFEEMDEVIKQPKPMTKNQLLLLQAQLAANPTMKDTPVIVDRPSHMQTSTRSTHAGPANRRLIENDGELPNFEEMVADLRRRRAHHEVRHEEEETVETRPRSRIVEFQPGSPPPPAASSKGRSKFRAAATAAGLQSRVRRQEVEEL